jgi:hypothetical protein
MAATKTITSVVEIIKIWNSASIKDKDVLKKLGMTKEMFLAKYKESNTMKSRCRNCRPSIVNLEAIGKAAKKATAAPAPAKAAPKAAEKKTETKTTTKSAPKAAKATASEAIDEEKSLSSFSNEELVQQIMEGDGDKTVYMSTPGGREKAYKFSTKEDLETKIALFSREQRVFNTQPYKNGSPIPTSRIQDGDHIVIKTKEAGA